MPVTSLRLPLGKEHEKDGGNRVLGRVTPSLVDAVAEKDIFSHKVYDRCAVVGSSGIVHHFDLCAPRGQPSFDLTAPPSIPPVLLTRHVLLCRAAGVRSTSMTWCSASTAPRPRDSRGWWAARQLTGSPTPKTGASASRTRSTSLSTCAQRRPSLP